MVLKATYLPKFSFIFIWTQSIIHNKYVSIYKIFELSTLEYKVRIISHKIDIIAKITVNYRQKRNETEKQAFNTYDIKAQNAPKQLHKNGAKKITLTHLNGFVTLC